MKEEPKQIKCYCGHTITCDCSPLEEPKQETLEEAAHEYFKRGQLGFEKAADTETAFLKGAEWQADNIIKELETHISINEHDWSRNPQAQLRDFIEQFKKK